MRITLETIRKAKRTADALNLSGRELLDLEPRYIIESCNGIGPDAWPIWLRDLITLRYKAFFVPSMIHDLRWQIEADNFKWENVRRNFEAFGESNREFYENCWKVADNYHWLNPLRYIRKRQAKNLFETLNAFGYGHYLKTITRQDLERAL